MNVGSEVQKRVDEIDRTLPEKEQELEALTQTVRAMRKERRELRVVLRQLRGSASTGPVVSDEQILEAVRALGGQEIAGMTVAAELGVTTRHVARKLRKLVDDGKLSGDPGEGYTILEVAVP